MNDDLKLPAGLPPDVEAILREELSTQEEADAFFQKVKRAYDEPSATLGGLSPDQAVLLMSSEDWLSGDGALALDDPLPAEAVAEAEILRGARTFLATVSEQGRVKATVAGNLNRRFVRAMLEAMEIIPITSVTPSITPRNINERDYAPLQSLRIALEYAGLLERSGGYFVLSEDGEELRLPELAPLLYTLLFDAFFEGVELATLDHAPPYPAFQDGIAYAFFHLGRVGGEWHTASALAGEVLPPGLLHEMPPLHQEIVVRSRLLEPLRRFALVERRLTATATDLHPDWEYRKSTLYDRFLSFDLEPHTEADGWGDEWEEAEEDGWEEAEPAPPLPPAPSPKVGRNEPCPCGSGKKYKRCCGSPASRQAAAPPEPDPFAEGQALAELGRAVGAPDDPITLPDPRAMERASAAIDRALEGQSFDSVDEMNAYLQRVIPANGDLPEFAPRTPLQAAQALIYDAVEVVGDERLALAHRALEIFPDCADAYCILAEEAKSAEFALAFYAEGVAAGERALGKEFFAENIGDFWGLLESRPYMRALLGLADCLRATGRTDEAIDHYREILRLNPNDNQGVRYPLLAALLLAGDLVGASTLMDEYREEWSPVWHYGRALHTFLTEGEWEQSDALLATAREHNDHLAPYLLDEEPIPELPPIYEIGSPEEAIIAAYELHDAWQAAPGATAWLAREVARRPEM